MTTRKILVAGLLAGALGAAIPVHAGSLAGLNIQVRLGARRPVPIWSENNLRCSPARLRAIDAIIVRAYRDILGRDPDASGLRSYRLALLRDGWSEQDLRDALMQSDEYRAPRGWERVGRASSVDQIIYRAYRDVLHRNPDPSGLETYRQAVLERGWDEEEVRAALRRSVEGQGLWGETREVRGQDRVTRVVRDAFLNVLNREPGPEGLRYFGDLVAREGWSQADVEQALRDSEEYWNNNAETNSPYGWPQDGRRWSR